MPTCVLYMRQSLGREGETEETSLSLDSQESQIRAWCDRENFTIQDTYRDHGFRGTTLDRPGWNQLIEHVSANRVDAVVVFALSRIARDSYLQETAWRQLKAMKIRLISVTEPSSEDTLVRGILGAVSQVERERLGKFVAAAHAERTRRGKHIAPPPYGLMLTGATGTPDREVVIDPDRYPIAREMAERLMRGDSIYSVWDWLVSSGHASPRGGVWQETALRTWLRSPSLAGAVRRGDLIVWDAHPGIVTRDEFDLMQRQVDQRKRTRTSVGLDTWLRGSIYHVCGQRMIIATSGAKRKYHLYSCMTQFHPAGLRCDCLPRSVERHKIEQIVKELIAADLAATITPEEAVAVWQSVQGRDTTIKRRKALLKQREEAKARASRAEALYLSGKRDAIWLNEQDLQLSEVVAGIDRELAAMETPPDIVSLNRKHRTMSSVSNMLGALEDQGWKDLIKQLGTVIVTGRSATMQYSPDVAHLLHSSTLTWTGPNRT